MRAYSDRFRWRRNQAGAAMVEFSILMLVFVPCLLYGFFLADASYHQLEVQETVISTSWDFSQRTQQSEDISGGLNGHINAVQAANRAEYSDHTSSFEDMNDLTGQNEGYHNQLAAKSSWDSESGTDYASQPGQRYCGDLPQVGRGRRSELDGPPGAAEGLW